MHSWLNLDSRCVRDLVLAVNAHEAEPEALLQIEDILRQSIITNIKQS
jgi:hypothetical protein